MAGGFEGDVRYRSSNASIYELYRIDLTCRLLELGHPKEEMTELSLDAQRVIVQSLKAQMVDCFDLSDLFDAPERLDRKACSEIFTNVRTPHGGGFFALEFAPAVLQELGQRWWHGRTAVFQEHFVTTILRSHFSAIAIEQEEHLRPALRVIVTTPHGELHEVGAMLASITAQEAGHETIFRSAASRSRNHAGRRCVWRAHCVSGVVIFGNETPFHAGT